MSAEQAVIGSILLSNGRALDDINLKPGDFLSAVGEQIFAKAQEFYLKGKPVDVITLSAELPHLAVAMHEAMSATPTAEVAEHYALIVAEQATKRRLKSFADGVSADVSDPESTIVIDDVRKQLDDALGSNLTSVNFLGSEIYETINRLGETPDFIASPWSALNDVIGGFRPGALYLIAARPGVGKTVIGLQIALEMAKHGGVAFSSLEMGRAEIHKRIIAQTARVHMAELMGQKEIDPRARLRIAESTAVFDLPLAIDDRAGVNVYDIRSFARSVNRKNKLAAVVVDYVGLIADHTKKDKSRYEAVTFISQQLKVLARDLNVPVIALAQLNREAENRKDQKPALSDLRDSGSLEQDADVVIMLRRLLEVDKNKIDLAVMKNRHGETKVVELTFEGEYSRALNR